jgi:hypothetical protein
VIISSHEPSGDEAPSRASVGRRKTMAGAVCSYRIEVLALSVPDVVRSAGGWLFDRVQAGWSVTVVLTEPGDIRPLRILGLSIACADVEVGSNSDAVRLLAASTDVLANCARVRDDITNALDRGDVELTLWGDVLPLRLQRRAKTVQYRLSAAACAFKSQALLAASLPEHDGGPTETLYSCSKPFLLSRSGLSSVDREDSCSSGSGD